MKILIVAATEAEVNPLNEKLRQDTGDYSGFRHLAAAGITADILVSGIGMVAMAWATGRQLQREKYDLVLNVGIAGSFNPDIPVGSVVNVVEDSFPEMGAETGDGFLGISEMGFEEFDSPPYRKGILSNQTDFQRFGLEKLPRAKGITSNTIHGSAASVQNIVRQFHPDVETMEGAAFLFVCRKEKLPCAQIRAISNMVEVRNRAAWKVDQAIRRLTETVMDTFEILNTAFDR